ncbi:tetratricopeptide (TPR) repeat protein [Allocatelliglobosispora scoriae]|uniref:Tetratricopeptide (TPR) repeat protein n=1 Tax=Allocatelliglobosispora scoriae TaxID=643052 RepID=A0A841C3D8_9ACTN|nr:tetratricopeptide (TPR) repeat protein [Allocatelliglobosispora scoriae]
MDLVTSLDELARLLRDLRRRHARRRGGAELTYRELAALTGWSHGIIGEYLAGRVLPPTERFDVLIRLLGAGPAEQGALATARDRVEEARRPAAAPLAVPRQLPGEAFGFTGRESQLAELDALLDRGAHTIGTVCGTAGVGKTTLAVRWAHRTADRFPDGQLYADLRGYDDGAPLLPGDTLARFMRALGATATEIPTDLDERAAGYRTLISGRRMLLVLDNAADVDQVRPLLPGTPTCLVLVTSRSSLAGLAAREGAHRVTLDVLADAEAIALLRTVIGDRVDAEPDAAAEIARRCARLPLALRIAAELAVARPASALGQLAADLRDEAHRLDRLHVPGDPRTAVRSVFSWSHRRLSPTAARAFGLLGLHPGRDYDAHDVAALTGAGLAGAQAALDELARAHLVAAHGTGFAMHDLLRAYAAECAPEEDAPLTRLFDHYLSRATAATAALYPHDRTPQIDRNTPHGRNAPHGRTVTPDPVPDEPNLDDPVAALTWLDRHRPNLVAVATTTARHSVGLSRALWRYYEVGGHHEDALAVHTAAAQAARETAAGLAGVLINLGNVYWWLGDHRRAQAHFEEALDGHRREGDLDGEARALARLGVVHERLGHTALARERLAAALALYRRGGDRHGEGVQLVNLGALHRRTGEWIVAAELHEAAAELFAHLGDRRLLGYALGNLGADCRLLGRHADALAHLERALELCRETGDPGGTGSAHAAIGAVLLAMGDPAAALQRLQAALAISRDIGDRALETEVLNHLGETLRAMGEAAAALDRHHAALALARRTGDQFEQARALDGIGRAHPDEGFADEHRRQALAIYERLGAPEADAVRAGLSRAPR